MNAIVISVLAIFAVAAVLMYLGRLPALPHFKIRSREHGFTVKGKKIPEIDKV